MYTWGLTKYAIGYTIHVERTYVGYLTERSNWMQVHTHTCGTLISCSIPFLRQKRVLNAQCHSPERYRALSCPVDVERRQPPHRQTRSRHGARAAPLKWRPPQRRGRDLSTSQGAQTPRNPRWRPHCYTTLSWVVQGGQTLRTVASGGGTRELFGRLLGVGLHARPAQQAPSQCRAVHARPWPLSVQRNCSTAAVKSRVIPTPKK